MARTHYTVEDNGLLKAWSGFVWLNPPYSKVAAFMARMAEHNNGLALIYARTDTKWFHEYVFQKALGLCFLKGRLRFLDNAGREAKNSSGAPSVLIAYGEEAFTRLLERTNGLGALVRL
jgi:hypothetical protein